jgi:hypothetical protein
VTNVAVTDKVEALKNEKMGPPGPCSSRYGSQYSMSRTCGPQDIISLVIPKLGDNMQQFLVKMCIYLNMRNALHIYLYLYLCKESHELWRNNLTKSNTMWMDYNQINLWVFMEGILQLFIRKKI